jgi:hypothetical protein
MTCINVDRICICHNASCLCCAGQAIINATLSLYIECAVAHRALRLRRTGMRHDASNNDMCERRGCLKHQPHELSHLFHSLSTAVCVCCAPTAIGVYRVCVCNSSYSYCHHHHYCCYYCHRTHHVSSSNTTEHLRQPPTAFTINNHIDSDRIVIAIDTTSTLIVFNSTTSTSAMGHISAYCVGFVHRVLPYDPVGRRVPSQPFDSDTSRSIGFA